MPQTSNETTARGCYVFDAYGTLFNLHAAAERHKDAIGPKWQQLSQTWRTKHIEYTWVHSLSGQPATFWDLAQRSLDYAIVSVGVTVSAEVRGKLLAAYRTMDAYPEVAEVLAALKARGARLAILSNGDPDMLDDAVRAARLDGLLDAVLSVTSVGIFKPAPAVYRLATERFDCAAGRHLLPVLQPLGHRRRQGVRLPHACGSTARPRRTNIRTSRPIGWCAICEGCWSEGCQTLRV